MTLVFVVAATVLAWTAAIFYVGVTMWGIVPGTIPVALIGYALIAVYAIYRWRGLSRTKRKA